MNLMIDFETFGVDPETCGIMSVALVPFETFEGEEPEEKCHLFYATLESNWLAGRDVESCRAWWLQKERSAALSHYLEEAKSEAVTVDLLEDAVIGALNGLEKRCDVTLWSRGDFDIRILKAIFRRNEAELPVPFYKVRDARTYIMEHHIDESRFVRKEELEHVALHDCRRCIREIQYINRALRDCGFFRAVDAITPEESRQRMKSRKEE